MGLKSTKYAEIILSFLLLLLFSNSCSSSNSSLDGTKKLEELYAQAIKNTSRSLTEADIYNKLIPIIYGESPLIQWKIVGTDTLMAIGSLQDINWLSSLKGDKNEYYSSDIDQAIWCFIPKEFDRHILQSVIKDDNINLRFLQLVGLPYNSTCKYIYQFWVNKNDLFRPSYNPTTATTHSSIAFPDNVSPEYKEWFTNFIANCYDNTILTDNYPFTKLGYTYDWASRDSHYGISEFIVKENAKIYLIDSLSSTDYYDRLLRIK